MKSTLGLICLGGLLWASLIMQISCSPGQRPEPVVSESRPRAVIVLADEAGEKATEAAKVLQKYLGKMTKTELPIQTVSEYEQDKRHGRLAWLVGPSRLTEAMRIEVEQNADAGDHYVIKSDSANGQIALVGNDAGRLRGTIYAAYDLLWRLGCGWYGPDELWQVVPEGQELNIPRLDVDERPAFALRDIWLVGKQAKWYGPEARDMVDAWRLGGVALSHGHALRRLAERDKYIQDHPDWYGPGQPSMTHPEVIKLVADNCRKLIDNQPQGIVPISLCANDHGGYAQRDLWAGNISSQTLYFANAVAKDLAKTHPNRYLLTFYGYWFGHDAPQPPRKAEPGVCVMQVNEGDHLKPWEARESAEVYQSNGRSNTRETKAFAAWRASGAQLGIYEWWIPGCGDENWRLAPWYPLETSLSNYRYWKKGGVRYISHESQAQFEKGQGSGFPLRWPLYYVGARGMWDPSLSLKQILKPACEQLFGPAAGHMYKYYRVFEKATMASKLTGENWRFPSPELIYTPKYEAEATRLIEAALAATQDPKILARIEQERKDWDEARAMLARLRENPQTFYQVYCDGKRMRVRSLSIKAKDISSLFGFAEHIPVFALADHGAKRLLDAEESIDLNEQNRFVTGPAE